MQVEFVDKLFRYFDERNIACEAALVPPISLQCRDTVRQARIIDYHDHDIRALLEQTGYFTVKGRKSSLVLADHLLIHP